MARGKVVRGSSGPKGAGAAKAGSKAKHQDKFSASKPATQALTTPEKQPDPRPEQQEIASKRRQLARRDSSDQVERAH